MDSDCPRCGENYLSVVHTFFEQAVFKESYKESAVELGASLIKDLELEVGKEALVLKLKWG